MRVGELAIPAAAIVRAQTASINLGVCQPERGGAAAHFGKVAANVPSHPVSLRRSAI
jgi:hypothetical protein